MHKKNKIYTRPYQPSDAQELANIFYHTLHKINIQDYTQEQIDVWAPPAALETDGWKKKWAINPPIVAVCHEQIVGFSTLLPDGYIDLFYVHHEWQCKGVGSALMIALEKEAQTQHFSRLYAEVSITARPFFEHFGFHLIDICTKSRDGISWEGHMMEKKYKR